MRNGNEEIPIALLLTTPLNHTYLVLVRTLQQIYIYITAKNDLLFDNCICHQNSTVTWF